MAWWASLRRHSNPTSAPPLSCFFLPGHKASTMSTVTFLAVGGSLLLFHYVQLNKGRTEPQRVETQVILRPRSPSLSGPLLSLPLRTASSTMRVSTSPRSGWVALVGEGRGDDVAQPSAVLVTRRKESPSRKVSTGVVVKSCLLSLQTRNWHGGGLREGVSSPFTSINASAVAD